MSAYFAYQAGVFAFEERDYKTAVERFTEALAEEPGNAGAREYLARAYYHRASLKPAEEECRRILDADPTNEYVLLLLARSLERQNKHDDAAGVRRLLAAVSGDESHLKGYLAPR